MHCPKAQGQEEAGWDPRHSQSIANADAQHHSCLWEHYRAYGRMSHPLAFAFPGATWVQLYTRDGRSGGVKTRKEKSHQVEEAVPPPAHPAYPN